MVKRAQAEAAGPVQRARVSVRPDEVVLRGSAIRVELDAAIPPESVGGVAVAGQRANVVLSDDGRVITVDTSSLPVGPHQLRIEELFPSQDQEADQKMAVAFVVVDSMARLPEDVAVHHAARLRITDLEVERLTMDGSADAPFVDVFKAEDRTSGEPLQLAFDERGERVDVDEQLRALEERRHRRYGKVHPTLHEAIRKADGERIPVAVWLVAQEEVVDKSTKGMRRRRPAHEVEAAERGKEVALRFADQARDYEFEMERVDEAAPILYGSLPAEQISLLAERDEVAGVFLYETMGELDLTNSIGIANSDDAQSSGVTGNGVNVAVYEDGPDNTSNLTITAQYSATPATSAHARHTHGIIKNVEPGAPHGHAPDCNLHSANSMDLDAIRWAAQDRGCTVISQSFHRASEQTTSTLSFDDHYKDNLVLHWPYPTICEASGNGASTEYVNHKGFNRLTVGNHNDTASGMSSDSVFRNPSSSHSDRELPEIAANGTGVTTVGLTLSGTSMAAPAVAGGAALIQQKAPTLKSWPEGCRAILLASAWRNPAGSTWRADLIAGVDGVDGSGALDSNAAVQITGSRRTPTSAPSRRGWDIGTFRSADVGGDGFATYTYRISVPATLFSPKVKVALAWDSKVTAFSIFGIPLLSSSLTVDLDLHIRDSAGNTVASSASWDNSYEIAEFAANSGQTYDIRIRGWSGTDDVWFGLAWTVTGIELFRERIELAASSVLGRR
jgi:hypothetical protein